VSTVVYLVNIQPSVALHGVTPLERLFGRPDDHRNIVTFMLLVVLPLTFFNLVRGPSSLHNLFSVSSLDMTLSVRDIVFETLSLASFEYLEM
jgi:hypothetical protein